MRIYIYYAAFYRLVKRLVYNIIYCLKDRITVFSQPITALGSETEQPRQQYNILYTQLLSWLRAPFILYYYIMYTISPHNDVSSPRTILKMVYRRTPRNRFIFIQFSRQQHKTTYVTVSHIYNILSNTAACGFNTGYYGYEERLK